jgi:5-methyltetrahydrofolate--homocysteine methyltransferase
MKKSVAYLTPYMEEEKAKNPGQRAAGKIVMATVKGDVHDIGKNIVGVVLSCTSYEVIDLGVMVPCERILEAAREEGADVIGLSGLITPSLDEMMHVASEMKRGGMELPLLIGGATTSPAHTAIKIAPRYEGSIVHVLDASRAVPVMSSLLSDERRTDFAAKNEARHAQLREEFGKRKGAKKLIGLEEARANRFSCDWATQDIAVPESTGVKVIEDLPLSELVPFIDWSPFFHTWELRGRWDSAAGVFRSADKDAAKDEEAGKLHADALELLEQIVKEKAFKASGVYGFFPANSVGDDIELYTGEDRSEVLTTFHTLRQQMAKKGKPNYALSDYVAPKESEREDFVGGFVCTAGHGVDEFAAVFEAEHDDYNSILAKAIADRLAEAFAEYMHKKVREHLGYGKEEDLSNDDLVRERYRGIRPAGGYPSQPDHTEKRALFKLLGAEEKAGVELTESMAMHPGASVSGLYFSHPESRYFAVGELGKDQVEDYAGRKGMTLKEAERWLAPNIGYR